jgi:hypothetical protein
MIRICPNPKLWAKVHAALKDYAGSKLCDPPTPPVPLILAGWAYSSDLAKQQRWIETERWALQNGCEDIVRSVSSDDFYYVSEISTSG